MGRRTLAGGVRYPNVVPRGILFCLRSQKQRTTAFKSFKMGHVLALAANRHVIESEMARIKQQVERVHGVSLHVASQQEMFGFVPGHSDRRQRARRSR